MQNDECRMQSEEKTLLPGIDSAFCVHRSASGSFPRSHRLSGKLLFASVYDAKIKTSKGPLVAYSLPNSLGHARLGISISRRVGVAPRRNRIKRLLREAFRLNPAVQSMDFIIVVRPHAPFALSEYQTILGYLTSQCHQHWQRKGNDV